MSLHSFFNPVSIVVIGVSDNPKKVGYLVAKNCIEQGYKGELYFVNPKHDTLLGKKVYKSIADIDKPIDLAVLALPADISLGLLDELHTKGVKNVVMYAAGFKETSSEGQEKEELLIKKAAQYGMTILGPNCLGFVSTVSQANVTFLKYPAPKGNIGLISQSGALGSLMVDYLVNHKNFGFSYLVSLGNKSVIDESHLLEFLGEDQDTQVIAMYLEDVKDGERFKKTLASVTKKKPVVILKSGATEAGSQAAVSHTGSMMGDDAVYSSVFRQFGAIRADKFYEFMSLLKIFSYGRIPSSKDILILSNAGGIGVLLTDDLVKNDMSLVTISEDMKQEIIRSMGGDKISVHNPIDLLGDASAFDYKQAIASTIQQNQVGAVMILLTPQANTEIAETAKVIGQAAEHFDKAIYPVFMGEKSVGNAHALFEEMKIASFFSYDSLPLALAKILRYEKWKRMQADMGSQPVIQTHNPFQIPENKKLLNLEESMDLVHSSGIPAIALYLIKSVEDLIKKADELGYPLVAKIASETITHKTDVKGIYTNITNEKSLFHAWDSLTAITGEKKIYIQQMAHGYELIVGGKRDRVFGPVMLVGLGGIYAELLKETVHYIYPLSLKEFHAQLEKTKLLKLIRGFRSRKPLSVEDLYDIVMRVGMLLHTNPRISEIDINPLMVDEGQPIAVDGRVVL
ncbi:MAG: acetate--CoA ligase family protein [Patescibacteria group bacterium]